MSDDKTNDAPPEGKKKGKRGKWLLIGGALIVLTGAGVGGGLYASQSGLLGGGAAHAVATGPQLVPRDQQERKAIDASKDGAPTGEGGLPTPAGEGGSKHASTYYALEKEFTSNLSDSVHFIQVGIAVSTPYDKTVIENLMTHEIAVRSAVLMALGETSEDEVFTAQGKQQLQKRLADAINRTLREKEGFGGVGNVYFTNFVVQ